MKAIPPALKTHLLGDVTTTALCWIIEKRDGTTIRGTTHDKDVTITAEEDSFYNDVYPADNNISATQVKSSSDGSVDNMEVDGAVSASDEQRLDVRVIDIESGNLSQAPVTVFLCNWSQPNGGIYVVRKGYLGEISRTSDLEYKTEIRGLTQLLAQSIVMTYSERCQVKRFGDNDCGFDLSDVTFNGTVGAVVNRKRFDTILQMGSVSVAEGFFRLGELTITSGENEGIVRQVKLDSVNGNLGSFSLWDSFPYDVPSGATFTVSAGCDRLITTCKRFGRLRHGWRGYGVYIPGLNALMAGPIEDGGPTKYRRLFEELTDLIEGQWEQ